MIRLHPPTSPAPPPGSGARLWLGPLYGARASVLAAEERAWGRPLTPQRRRRYWQSRAALRQWLAGILRCAPVQVPLHSPPGAPPCLKHGAGWVSLSHSGDALLLGFSAAPIGVDLEPAGRPLAAAELMRRCFPPGEVMQLAGLPPERLRGAVLTSWVLKEAAIKWRRRSLALDLARWQLNHVRGCLCHLEDGTEPECRTGLAAGWRWGVVGAGAEQSILEVAAAMGPSPAGDGRRESPVAMGRGGVER